MPILHNYSIKTFAFFCLCNSRLPNEFDQGYQGSTSFNVVRWYGCSIKCIMLMQSFHTCEALVSERFGQALHLDVKDWASDCVIHHGLYVLPWLSRCHWDMHIHLLHQLGGPITSHIINPWHIICHNPSGRMKKLVLLAASYTKVVTVPL